MAFEAGKVCRLPENHGLSEALAKACYWPPAERIAGR